MTATAARFALLAVIAGGLVLRLVTIGELGVCFDEAISYTLACDSTWRELVERTASDFHPPLSYVLLGLWSQIAGTSVVGLRMFSTFWSVVAMIGCYLFCRDAFSAKPGFSRHPNQLPGSLGDTGAAKARWIGVSAAALIASCSIHIKWSQEVRMYTLGTALVLFSSWMLMRALVAGERARWWWGAYVVCATAFAYTHNFALFSIAGQALFCAGVALRSRHVERALRGLDSPDVAAVLISNLSPRGSELKRGDGQRSGVDADCESDGTRSVQLTLAGSQLLHAVPAFLAVGIAYLPWMSVLLEQVNSSAKEFWTPRFVSWSIPDCLGALVAPTHPYLPDRTASVAVTAVFVALLGLLAWRGGAAGWLLVTMIVTPIVCSAVVSLSRVPIFIPRYFLFAYMFALCAVPYIAATLLTVPLRNVLILLLVANSVAGHVFYWTSLESDKHPGIAAAVQYVACERKPGEEVVVTHPTIYFGARYYLRETEPPPRLFVPRGARPHYLGGPAIPAKWRVDDDGLLKSGSDRIWILDIPCAPEGSGRPPLPRDWIPVAESRYFFRDDHNFLGTVSATAHARRQSPAVSAVK
jgi:hypothetical protein